MLDSLGPTTYTAFTLPQASELFAQRPDTISAVLVAAEAGVSRETLRDEIIEQVPARIEALTQAELTAEQQDEIGADFLDMFQTILLAFAGIALVVATFSIHNTFSILVAQRTRESALLRAIGASRRQVVVAVALEALVIGVVASAIGFGVGLGLAAGLAGADERRRAGAADGRTRRSPPARSSPPASSASLTTLVASVAPASRPPGSPRWRRCATSPSTAPAASKLRAVLGLARRRRRCIRRRHGDAPRPTAPWPAPASAPWRCSSASSCSGRSSPARRRPCSAPAPA